MGACLSTPCSLAEAGWSAWVARPAGDLPSPDGSDRVTGSLGWATALHGFETHETDVVVKVIESTSQLLSSIPGTRRGLFARAARQLLHRSSYRLPAREVRYRDRYDYTRRTLLSDHMGLIGVLGLEERLPTRVWSQLQSGGWAIDVGANVGLVTAPLCERVGPSGAVWAIEPVPQNAARLRQLRSDNALPQLSVLEGALGDTNGTASIRLPAGGESGWASFTKSWDTSGELAVKTWRLDDLHESFPPQRLDFVKIDVEGYEPQVLQGASATLKRFRPLLMCELNDILLRDAGSSSAAVVGQLRALGYRRVDKARPRSHSTIEDALFAPEDRWAPTG